MSRPLMMLVAVGLAVTLCACGGGDAVTTTAARTTTAPPTATAADQAGAVTEMDLVYATWEEGSLTLDMHVPAEPGGAPIVVYLPGRGLRNAPPWLVEGLVEEGAIVFVVRYARGGAGPEAILSDVGAYVRAMGESVACAIHFARERASELGSDEPNLVLSGFSLGGGVAAHAALFGTTLEARWDEYGEEGGPPHQVDCNVTKGSTHVDALVGMGGAYDLFVPAYEGKYGRAYQQENDPELQEFLAGSIGTNPELEVHLIHGEADYTIPYENSVGFADMLADAGYDVHLTGFDGGHSEPKDVTGSTSLEVIGPYV